MADDGSGEKTEEASPKKLRDAREKGQVAKSRDITGAFLFITGFAVLLLFQRYIGKELSDHMRSTFSLIAHDQATLPVLNQLLFGALLTMTKCVAPILLALFVVSLAATYMQVGSLFTLDPLTPKLSKLNPIAGFKNMFKLNNFIELLKSTIKIVVSFYIVYGIIRDNLRYITLTMQVSVLQSLQLVSYLLQKIITKIGLAFLVVGVADYFYQRYHFKKELRMSKYEVKKEYENEEGKPEIKSHRRQMHQEMAMSSALNDVPKSDVVVVNPEHIAVAIKYDAESMNAPRVTAKGRNLIAQKIIELAKKHNIPIMRNVPLAHALNKLEIGDDIPEELYQAVADVLQWVYTLKDEEP